MKDFKIVHAAQIMVLYGNCPYCGQKIDLELDADAEEPVFEEDCPTCHKEFKLTILNMTVIG